jgi:hypothetical protein
MGTTTENIQRLLEEGHSVATVASRLNCSRRWVDSVASRLSLPRNPPIRPATVNTIARSYIALNGNISRVAARFSQTPSRIREVIDQIKKDHS